MATRSTEPRINRAQTKSGAARAIAIRRDEQLRKVAAVIVSGLGMIALLLLLTNP